MEELLNYYQQFMELSRANPIVAGAIGLWGAGLVTYLLRHIPDRMWRMVTRLFSRELKIMSMTTDGPNKNYDLFLQWFTASGYGRWSYTLQLITTWKGGSIESLSTAGYGKHYFIFRGRLFWFTKTLLSDQMGENIKESVTVGAITTSLKIIHEFVDTFKWVKTENSPIQYIYNLHGGGWEGYWNETCQLEQRDLKTIAANEGVKELLVNRITKWLGEAEFFQTNGIPYKLSIQLTGSPGNGKTSLARALAARFKRDVYVIRLGDYQQGSIFAKSFWHIPAGSVILIEDYDTCHATWSRAYHDQRIEQKKQQTGLPAFGISGFGEGMFTLSDILNVIDGVVPLTNQILIWTTNRPEIIDEALLRSGRMDLTVEISELRDGDIRRFIINNWPEANVPVEWEFANIKGADLSALLIANAGNVTAFVESIPHRIRN